MTKGLIRSGSRRGVRADKAPAVARKTPRPREPAVCRRCGSVFVRRTWRADRARFTQPERRLVSAERHGSVLEVLTTSQKLAHRIVHELKKAFRGRARYAWSAADGSLLATWERES